MKNKRIVLLRALLQSTSQINTLKYTKDKKKRGKVIGGLIGASFLYLMMMAYCILACIGMGYAGQIASIPGICVITIALVSFVFTVFKTNGYLFNFKEYDMLMALPLEAKTIAGDKFLYMYVKSMPWFLSIALSMMIGYGIYEKPSALIYIEWIILSAFMPVIPMLAASLIGVLIAKVSSGFKQKSIIQTVLGVGVVIFSFSLRFIIQSAFKDNGLKQTMEGVSAINGRAETMYFPAKWFSEAINNRNVLAALAFVVLSAVLFELAFYFVGKSYRQINSALKSHGSARKYVMSRTKKRSQIGTIAYKEFKRLTGSSVYMTNMIVGEVMVTILGVVALIFSFDSIIAVVTEGAPVTGEMIYPAIPLIVYFLVGMVPTTACSPSLEGKNFWILQSCPIDKKDIYKGKMLFNLYLTVPFAIFGTLCLCISAKAPLLNSILYLVEILVLCCFSTTWGCLCGVKHIKLEWENEIEVVKQGAAVAIYLFPNMFGTMGIVVLVVFLGTKISGNMITILLSTIMAVLALVCYMRTFKISEQKKL